MSEASQPISIVDVRDLSKVDPRHLSSCLRDLRRWVLELQKKSSAEGASSHEPGLQDAGGFQWTPPVSYAVPEKGHLARDTPLHHLGLSRSLCSRLGKEKIFTLQDLAKCSVDWMHWSGLFKRDQLREVILQLNRSGLSPRPSEMINLYALELSEQIRSKEAPARGSLHDESLIFELGLTPEQMTECIRRKLITIRDLRSLSLHTLVRAFRTRHSTLEVIQRLSDESLPVHCSPSKLDMWRVGLCGAEELDYPADHADISELRPWLDSETLRKLKLIGIDQVYQVRDFVNLFPLVRMDLGVAAYEDLFRHFNVKVCPTWRKVFLHKGRLAFARRRSLKTVPSLLDRIVFIPTRGADASMDDYSRWCEENEIPNELRVDVPRPKRVVREYEYGGYGEYRNW